MITLSIAKINTRACLPKKKTECAAGWDVYACLDNKIFMEAGAIVAVPTGLCLGIPTGYFVSIRARSGLALNHGITLPNGPGTIDQDYRGELKILLINLSHKPFTISHHDRIAQMLLEKEIQMHIQEINVNEIISTKRGENGFGSTGL